MASETFWTATSFGALRNAIVGMGVGFPGQGRRVCVRVDECPESIKRSEVAKVLKLGWEVQYIEAEVGVAWMPVSGVYQDRRVDGFDAACCNISDVTDIRPHNEAPWIKVED